MDLFLRTCTIYLFLLILFRLTGKRTLSQISTFDFVLLLIISEATENALLDGDNSMTAGIAVILTLVMLDLSLTLLKNRYIRFERFTEGVPLVLVDHGKMLRECMDRTQVSESDILQSARASQGLERMDQIKYAVLEATGGISIIPMEIDFDSLLDRKIAQALYRSQPANPDTPRQ